MSLADKFIVALKSEIIQRKKYLGKEAVETIYFGGGTPSVLTAIQIEEILNTLAKEFQISESSEITFEANPDDLSKIYLDEIRKIGINRLSIGIQSFQNELLKKMNRRHDQQQAMDAIELAVKAGFTNISADLIYGLPGLTSKQWKSSLSQIFQLPVQHLSAYHLTYHEGTPFYTWLKKGTLKELEEPESIRQFETLVELCEKHGFEQYEISNFAVNKLFSKHNSSYWLGTPYLGLGPSAHSFNGASRRWNISHVENYISSLEKGNSYFEEEELSENEKYNEFILTRIRTIWGISISQVQEKFGIDKSNFFQSTIEKYVKSEHATCENNIYKLTRKGLFMSDEIMVNLMFI